MTTRLWCVFLMLCLVAVPTSPARAAAPDPAAVFVQTERLLLRPTLSSSLLPSAQQNPAAYLGQVFLVTATVGGLVSADGDRTALLTIGDVSLAAKLSSHDAAWVDSGQTIRALLRVETEGNDLSLSNLRVLAAAPEFEMVRWERDHAAPAQSGQERRAFSYPSRSLAYQRQPVESVAPNPTSWPAGYGPVAPLPARALAIYAPYRATVRRMGRHLSERDVDKITTSVLYFSDRNNIDPRLVVAMIIAESGFDVGSTSRTGAMGLGQLMPGTARGLGVTDPYDPIQNIAASVHILRGNLDKYGGAPSDAGLIPFDQIALTMAAYNAGPGAVRKFHGVPPYRETKRYVARVTSLYKQMCGMKG